MDYKVYDDHCSECGGKVKRHKGVAHRYCNKCRTEKGFIAERNRRDKERRGN